MRDDQLLVVKAFLGEKHPVIKAWMRRQNAGRTATVEILKDAERDIKMWWHALRSHLLFSILDGKPPTARQCKNIARMLDALRTLIDDKQACGMRCESKEGVRVCDSAADVAMTYALHGKSHALARAKTLLNRKTNNVVPSRTEKNDSDSCFTPTSACASLFLKKLEPKNRLECAANQRDQLRMLINEIGCLKEL